MPNGKERFSFILTEQGPANFVSHESSLALYCLQINFVGAQTCSCISIVCACSHTNRVKESDRGIVAYIEVKELTLCSPMVWIFMSDKRI